MSEKKKRFSMKGKTVKDGDIKPYANKVTKSDAKLAYLNGETNREKLCKIGGCHVKTLLESWLPEFEKEKKQMILGFSNSSFQLGVTDTELQAHFEHIRQLRNVANQYSKEISDFDDMRNSLKTIVSQLKDHPDFIEKDFTSICSLLNIFVTSKKALDTTINQYIKVTNEWSKATGVEAHHSAAAARIKEAERLRGKDDAGRDPFSPTSDGDEANKASGDPFFGKTRKL